MSLRQRNLGGLAPARIIFMMFASLLTVGPNSPASRYVGEINNNCPALTVPDTLLRRWCACRSQTRRSVSRKTAGSYKTKRNTPVRSRAPFCTIRRDQACFSPHAARALLAVHTPAHASHTR